MTNILPIVDWAAEALRPTLLGILRRLDKTFNKIYKKPSIRVSGDKIVLKKGRLFFTNFIMIQRYTDWYAAGELIKGVYEILSEHPFIVHIPHFKALISTCQVSNITHLGILLIILIKDLFKFIEYNCYL